MIGSNLRHLRVFLAVAKTGSVTRAAEMSFVSQPAVTQAISKLEVEVGEPLFYRTPQGVYPTRAGEILNQRTTRAMSILDTALTEVAPRLKLTATRPQLQALIAAAEAQNFSLAARRLGISQPTVHRAITQLEREAGRILFQRSLHGLVPMKACVTLARHAKLAFAELEQAVAELGDLSGREVGQIVIGAMPLSRSYVLPKALSAFRQDRPRMAVRVLDGPYDELLASLRRGEIDILIGALRDPLPIDDVVQERLFDDTLTILAGPGHPLLGRPAPTPADLADWPWLVARRGTPTRQQFDLLFIAAAVSPPQSIIETGSVILMREMVQDGHHLACVSRLQADREIERGLVQVLPVDMAASARPIGLTMRAGWTPTPAQGALLEKIRAVGG